MSETGRSRHVLSSKRQPRQMAQGLRVISLIGWVIGGSTAAAALVACTQPEAVTPRPPSSASPPRAQPGAAQCPSAQANGTAPILDDFEGNPQQLPANEGRGGWWFDYSDGTGGHLTRERATDKSGVLHVLSEGFLRWGAGFAASFSPASTAFHGCPYDASRYTGIRLRARGRGRLRLTLADDASTPSAQGGSCSRPASRCYDRPGVWLNLGEEWATYEFPFCKLFPEGWGGTHQGLDPSRLHGIHFRAEERQSIEAWLDDIAFYSADPGGKGPSCGPPCPLDAAPKSAKLEPQLTSEKLDDQLGLHTFEQETVRCGPITRRYLSYVPKGLPVRSHAPVLVMLHGSTANAESAHGFMAHGRFDALAERDHFIVVYGNAAPGSSTSPDPHFPNTGAWRQGFFDDGEVDDVAYLQRVLEDLGHREVIAGDNPIYLTGISNGGGMVLELARRLPDRVRGVAAVMPYDGEQPSPVPDLSKAKLRRVLFIYTLDDPGMSEGYHEILAPLPAQWARAMGIPEERIASATASALPDRVHEGRDYRGTSPVALRTRDSRVTQTDLVSQDGNAKVRILRMDHAGHFWPNPKQDTFDWVLSHWGFRNRDIDAADAVWDFLRPSSE